MRVSGLHTAFCAILCMVGLAGRTCAEPLAAVRSVKASQMPNTAELVAAAPRGRQLAGAARLRAPPPPAEGEPGVHHEVSADALPAPNTTLPNDITPGFFTRPAGTLPKVPDGFSIAAFATRPQLTHVRWLAVAPNGDVFLSEQGPGRITLMRDGDGDGKADTFSTFAQGFSTPHGLAFHDGALYVGDVRAVWRLEYHDGDMVARGEYKRFTAAPDLRPLGIHTTREIAFDSKGSLYLAIGARADLSEAPPPDATVQVVAADGTMTTFASGLRNVVGMAFYPGTDELWATVNERDGLGATLPPDFLAQLHKGDFFGWPYAYIGPHPDPTYGAKRPDLVAQAKTPDLLIEAHSAPLGVVFYQAAQFPAEYKGDAFVALHGSGPYDTPNGYKVIRVKFANGNPVGGYEDFATGFWGKGTPSPNGVQTPVLWGTPAGLAIAKDGSLLIADDEAATVWRVTYTGK